MPLVTLYKGRRIWKAKRAASLKGRPEWQDQDPGTPQGRDAYAIAAKYEQTFAKAFLEAIRGQITPEIERDFREAWKSGSPAAVINSIPYFTTDPDLKVWDRFLDKLSTAYLTVIQAAGDEATQDMNRKFKTDMEFYALPPPDEAEPVTKAMSDVRAAARGMTVNVNPYSIDWVREHGLDLVADGISPRQKETVTSIIQNAMEQGLRPTDAMEQIKANIGLTNREYEAVINRRILHEEAGLPQPEVERLTGKYQQELLKKRALRIARTETIAAQAQGRKDAWRVAQEAGKLPKVQRRWLAPAPSPDPNRPCDICLDLDGTTAPVDGVYQSNYIGEVPGPPAHPQCRCSESLERA